jgi:O-antigen/teichoic acid export membrane protein
MRSWWNAREASWVVSGQLLSAAGAVVGVRLLTSVLSPRSYGVFWLVLTLSLLSQHLVWAPLHSGILRFHALHADAGRDTFEAAATRLGLTFGGSVGLLGLVAGVVAALVGQREIAALVTLAAAISVAGGWEASLAHAQMAARRRWPMSLYEVALTWGRLLMAYGAIKMFGSSSVVALIGYGCGSIFGLTAQILILRAGRISSSRLKSDVDAVRRELAGYIAPFAVWGIFAWTQAVSDRWILALFRDASEVGIYVALYQVGFYPSFLVAAAIMEYGTPIVFQLAERGNASRTDESASRLVRVLVVIVLAVGGGMAALGWAFGGRITDLLLGERFHTSSWLIAVAMISGALFGAGQTATLRLMAELRVRELLTPKILVSGIAVVAYCIGASLAGFKGLAIANLVAALGHFVVMSFVGRSTSRPSPAVDI